jgi:hypothetical protein
MGRYFAVSPGITEEVGKQVGGFMEILRGQPLSLALVVMNFLLVAYLFYSGSATTTQRQETAKMIVEWQRETDKIMASCASIEVMKLVVDALERDRQMYRQLLPHPLPPPAPPKKED